MDIHVKFEGGVNSEKSYHLSQLANIIKKDTGFTVQIEKAEAPKGAKPIDLATGLSIASVALSSISTLITVLSYWKSQQPKYSITVTYGKARVLVDNVASSQIQSIVSQLEFEDAPPEMNILISGE